MSEKIFGIRWILENRRITLVKRLRHGRSVVLFEVRMTIYRFIREYNYLLLLVPNAVVISYSGRTKGEVRITNKKLTRLTLIAKSL
jgi:hypothetical protein